MGGATSRFAETDWDGIVHEATEEALDFGGLAPAHTILTLQKSSSLVNQREFEIRDIDTDQLLYKSKPIEGTSKWFDLCDASTGEQLFCIQTTDNRHDHWMIFRYNKPNWEEQQPCCEDLALPHPSTSPSSTKEEVKDKNIDDDNVTRLYRTARMDINWNMDHGNVYKYVQGIHDGEPDNRKGVLSTEHSVLQVEEIASKTAQYQSFVPYSENSIANSLLKHPPLVGCWTWEHTSNRHQMKMHLASGADIALHCISAIVTNMVYVERKTEDEDSGLIGEARRHVVPRSLVNP